MPGDEGDSEGSEPLTMTVSLGEMQTCTCEHVRVEHLVPIQGEDFPRCYRCCEPYRGKEATHQKAPLVLGSGVVGGTKVPAYHAPPDKRGELPNDGNILIETAWKRLAEVAAEVQLLCQECMEEVYGEAASPPAGTTFGWTKVPAGGTTSRAFGLPAAAEAKICKMNDVIMTEQVFSFSLSHMASHWPKKASGCMWPELWLLQITQPRGCSSGLQLPPML